MGLIEKILSLRQTMSKILGYKNYAEYSLATKMAKSSKEVISFLNNLKSKALNKSKKEIKDLNNYALKKLKLKIMIFHIPMMKLK